MIIELGKFEVVVLPIYGFVSNSLQIKYNYPVVISQNLFGDEVRRLVGWDFKRTIRGTFFVDTMGQNEFLNLLEISGGKLVGIPLVIEPVTPVEENLQGLDYLQVEESLEDYFNLLRSYYLWLYDYKRRNLEVHLIYFIDDFYNEIYLYSHIEKEFYKKTTVIYPLVVGVVQNVNIKFIKDKYCEVDLELQEVYI